MADDPKTVEEKAQNPTVADEASKREAAESAVDDELTSDELRGVAGGWTSQGPPSDCDP